VHLVIFFIVHINLQYQKHTKKKITK